MSLHRLFDQARQESESRMDLVPFLDMMIVLLIFFVVAASIHQQQQQKALEIQSARVQNAAILEDKHFVIWIDSTGQANHKGQNITLSAGLELAKEWHLAHPQGTIVLQGDVRGRLQYLAEWLDQLRGAGLHKVALGVETQSPASPTNPSSQRVPAPATSQP
jgi:biopolymer transport protein ExbD